MKKVIVVLFLTLFTVLFSSCTTTEEKIINATDTLIVNSIDTLVVKDTLYDTAFVDSSTNDKKKIKYVFLFIGDGMADAQINIAQQALKNHNFLPKHTSREIGFTKFPICGTMTTYAEDRYITGSAAAATAMATGYKTTIGTISLSGDWSDTLETIIEKIHKKKKGWKTGIITTVSIDHATPAAFYAHAQSRGSYYEIAAQMATSKVDFFAGGAKGERDKYKQGRTDISQLMINAGYKIVTSKSELNNLSPGEKVWTYNPKLDYYGSYSMLYDIDRDENYINLRDFTRAAINTLYNDSGFFIMVEGGKIDWACHANDVVSQIGDVIDFSEAVDEAIEFAKKHSDETLIIVTGDHETGGLSIGYAATKYESHFDLLAYQNKSYENFDYFLDSLLIQNGDTLTFEEVCNLVKNTFGLNDKTKDSLLAFTQYDSILMYNAYLAQIANQKVYNDEESYLRYGGYNPISVTATHILNNKAGIGWTTYQHTALPVPVYAKGVGEDEFKGMYDNTDIAKKLFKLLNL